MGISVFVGSGYQRQTILGLAELVNQCEPYGIPVMAVTAVGREMDKREARYLAMACRIAAPNGRSGRQDLLLRRFRTWWQTAARFLWLSPAGLRRTTI